MRMQLCLAMIASSVLTLAACTAQAQISFPGSVSITSPSPAATTSMTPTPVATVLSLPPYTLWAGPCPGIDGAQQMLLYPAPGSSGISTGAGLIVFESASGANWVALQSQGNPLVISRQPASAPSPLPSPNVQPTLIPSLANGEGAFTLPQLIAHTTYTVYADLGPNGSHCSPSMGSFGVFTTGS